MKIDNARDLHAYKRPHYDLTNTKANLNILSPQNWADRMSRLEEMKLHLCLLV